MSGQEVVFDPRSPADVFFTNELEAWIVKCPAVPNREAAVALAQRIMGPECTYVTDVRGHVRWDEVEGWYFTLDPRGDVEAWEVTEP